MPYLWTILAYLLLLIGVGVIMAKRVKSREDFVVAGRKLPARVLIGTLLATWIGSGSLIASAGLAYDRGFPALWFDAGVWVALVVLYFVAGRARRFAQFTVPDILETRYNKYARVLGTVITIIAYTAIVSYQFRAGGFVLNLITGIPVETGVIITAVFVIAYTVLAGMISVAYTDVVNGIVMTLGLLLTLPFLLSSAGGWNDVVSRLPAEHIDILGDLTLFDAIALALPTMLLLLGESGMYQRFFSAKDETAARKSVVGWIAGTIVIETLIVVLAVIGRSMFTDIDGETVILQSVKSALPLAIGCIALAAIVAVIVSTADSFLLVPATNFMRDIYQRFVEPDVSERRFLLFSRLAVVVLGLIAFLQLQFFQGVLEAALYAYTMYGVGITPAVMAAFFWKRATPAGGVCAMAAGMLITLVWELGGLSDLTGVATVYPALGGSVILLLVVSWLTPAPSEGKWRPFFTNAH
jgi:SSS family solute:Na+ symporter/sodium/proline symporter